MATPKKKCRKYSQDYLKFGFVSSLTNVERPMCLLCERTFSNEAMKPSKMKDHMRRMHPVEIDENLEFFEALKEKFYNRSKPLLMLVSHNLANNDDNNCDTEMDKYITGLKRKLNEADEAGTNKDNVTCENITTPNRSPKSRKYDPRYLLLGFTCKLINDQKRPMCLLCMKILAADSMKPNKLKRHLETTHAEHVGKPKEFFQRKLDILEKQQKTLLKTMSVSSNALLASYEVSHRSAKCEKPHSIGDSLVLPAAIDMVAATMLADKYAEQLRMIPLADNKVNQENTTENASGVEDNDEFGSGYEVNSVTHQPEFIDTEHSGSANSFIPNKRQKLGQRVSTLKHAVNELKYRPMSHTNQSEENEFDIFGLYVSTSLKKLSLPRAFRLQEKINSLIAEERISYDSQSSPCSNTGMAAINHRSDNDDRNHSFNESSYLEELNDVKTEAVEIECVPEIAL